MHKHTRLPRNPIKAPMLAEFVWDWFVDIRTSVTARIHPRLVLHKAFASASALLAEMRKSGVYVELPLLDKHWLRRWKWRYGVSLRKTNMRYTCSHTKLLARLRAMWKVNFRARALFKAIYKKELVIWDSTRSRYISTSKDTSAQRPCTSRDVPRCR